MRILTFLHSFEPGGVERDALRLNAEWAKLGADVRIVLGRREGRLAVAIPQPIRSLPSRIERGSSLRRDQPKRSAARA